MSWQKVKLGELLELKYGSSLPAQKRKHGDVPVYGSSGVDGWHNKAIINHPGIIVGRKGNIGATYYSKRSFFPIDTVYYVDELKKKGDLKFFYYLLKRIPFKRIGSDVGVPGLNRDLAYGLDVKIPTDTDEQKRIADIFSAFDDKIELNNKINHALEQMAQAIFKEWFLHFRFPGHEKVKFMESEMGRIPEGWEVKKIKDIAKINKGLSYSSEEIKEDNGGLPMINLANFVRGGGFKIEGIKFFNGRYNNSNLVKPGDIVIALTDLTSNREVIGHPARVPEISGWDKVLISLDVCSLETKENLKTFLYYLMLRRDFSYLMASSASGTNVSHLNKFVIEEYLFCLPPDKILEKFYTVINSMFAKANKLVSENQKLASLRDLLLPKLMSGKIRV